MPNAVETRRAVRTTFVEQRVFGWLAVNGTVVTLATGLMDVPSFLSIGANRKAARLPGDKTPVASVSAYVMSDRFAALSGIVTAVQTKLSGEAGGHRPSDICSLILTVMRNVFDVLPFPKFARILSAGEVFSAAGTVGACLPGWRSR